MVKNPPEMQDTRIGFLGQEHPLDKEMANHSNILAWRIPWTEEPGRLQSIGSHRFRHDRGNLARTHGNCEITGLFCGESSNYLLICWV